MSLTEHIQRWSRIYRLNPVLRYVPFDAFLTSPSIILWAALDAAAHRHDSAGYRPLLPAQQAIRARCAP